MNHEIVLKNTADYVKSLFDGEESGHDWWHIKRVVQVTRELVKYENADPFLCELSALLHDVPDDKLEIFHGDGSKKVKEILQSQKLPDVVINKVINIISTVSYKGGNNESPISLEAQIVQDADRLDAIGAIGIARCFTYAGAKGQLIHDPNMKSREKMTVAQYRHEKSTAINHFYEKLLKLKSLMNTSTGRRLANERHEFMEQYLNQFYNEWEGKI